MGSHVIEFKCLLVSPGDVVAERDALARLAQEWNAQVGRALGCRVELVRWETHVAPQLGESPQAVINREAVDGCDFAIAVFWARLGTPTDEYASGSVEEIERMRQRGAHVLVYFCSRAIPQDFLAAASDQYVRLQEAKAGFQQAGILGTFSDIAELERKVLLHLTSIATRLLLQERGDTLLGAAASGTLPIPDVRVKVTYGFVAVSPIRSVLVASVENHSPVAVFMGNVYINTRGVDRLVLIRDAITLEHQRRRALQPGEAFSLNFDPSEVLPKYRPEDLRSAGVVDDIGSKWSSGEDGFKRVLRTFF